VATKKKVSKARGGKPVILVTNDDGINAPGIRNLVQAMQAFGDVFVVAPDSPQSATGHSITVTRPLRLYEVDVFEGVRSWQCSGTPVDCVKLAVNQVLHRKPDLCVSGINHGSNSAINVIYSGTMSAAMEAAIEGIPSMGFSLLNHSFGANFAPARRIVASVVKNVLAIGLPAGTLLNVNIPDGPKVKGIRICRQANAKWAERYDERRDPNGRAYYWLAGKWENSDSGDDTDEWALAHGYASVVPVSFDLTAHHAIPHLNSVKWRA
jgi:5'-nucleotidase